MKTQTRPPQLKPSKLTTTKREAVFREYGRRCHYPSCTLEITERNYLCVHDITDTGQHSHIRYLRPVCMTHHNQATADAKSAKRKMKRFRAQGIQINENPCHFIMEDFYGKAVGA